jgi:hypothetical protein
MYPRPKWLIFRHTSRPTAAIDATHGSRASTGTTLELVRGLVRLSHADLPVAVHIDQTVPRVLDVLAAEWDGLRIVPRRTSAMATGFRAARVQQAAQGDEARSSARRSPRIGRAKD